MARSRRRFRPTVPIALVGAIVIVALAVAVVWGIAGRPVALRRMAVGAPDRVAAAGVALSGVAHEASRVKPAPQRRTTVIAWQPSHQADTGTDWEEYVICGDIVDRVIALLPEFGHIKAWETGMGLTGSNGYRPQPKNTPAFDSEIAQANAGGATLFVAIHNDGAAPSGVLGMCMPDDSASRRLVERFKSALCGATGLPDRGIREERLYSLEPTRNKAARRLLLEIGDNKADRAFLLDKGNRKLIASALADALRESDLP